MPQPQDTETMLGPYRVLDLTDEKGLLCGKVLGDLGDDVDRDGRELLLVDDPHRVQDRGKHSRLELHVHRGPDHLHDFSDVVGHRVTPRFTPPGPPRGRESLLQRLRAAHDVEQLPGDRRLANPVAAQDQEIDQLTRVLARRAHRDHARRVLGGERVGERGEKFGRRVARQQLGEDALGVGLEPLARVWQLFQESQDLFHVAKGETVKAAPLDQASYARLQKKMHQTIRKVGDDIGKRFHLNTAISAIMEFTNTLKKEKEILKILESDARITSKQISVMTGSPMAERRRWLSDAGSVGVR